MTNQEISDLLNKESYKVWDTTKVIKNQDYHDGVVKGLKMAAKLVAKLWKNVATLGIWENQVYSVQNV